jgi:hypothetical protein
VDERKRFMLLFRTLEPRRRGEIRRLAWFGRQAPDAETAWYVKMLTEGVTTAWRGALLVGIGLLWVAVGTVTIVLISDRGADRPFGFGLAVAQIVVGLLGLALQMMYRRARRVNEPIAVPPGR